ncbi:MAG: LicD family protein [Butyrivibrio sp.]|nr:LicD family protein [Butyrivibrio sp.]
MLAIPEDFFKEEIRLGFVVSEAMKRAWAVQINMLDEILEVADKHGIRVWLDYGTLLGAVRHHGYVPWDDDLDISVMRSDYLPLLRYLEEELPPYRDVLSFHNNPRFNQPKAVISSRKNIDVGNDPVQEKITKLHYGFPCSTWVDIFPMDYVPDDPERWNNIRNLYLAAHDLALNMDILRTTGEFEETLTQLERITETPIKRDENIRASIWLLSEKIATLTTKKESHYLAWYHDNTDPAVKKMRPTSAFARSLYVEFELIKAPIPVGYDEVLRSVYGSQYMTPKKGGTSHDYPHFLGNERIILSSSILGQLGDIF